MIELAQLKTDFCFLVQSLWHSLSLYFQLGCAPSERPECGFSLKKSPILPQLSSLACKTADWQHQAHRKVRSPGKSQSQFTVRHSILRGWAVQPAQGLPQLPLCSLLLPVEGSLLWAVSIVTTILSGHAIWKRRMRPLSTWALGAGMWKGRLMCCWSLCWTLSTKVSGEGLQSPLGAPRLTAHLLSSERHFWGTKVESPEKGLQILGQGMATLPRMPSM